MQFSPAQDIIRRTMGRTILLAFQLSNISVLMAVKCLWKEKEVVYVTVVVLEVVVASFLGYVIKMQRSKAGERGGVFDELS
ncbi:hypothetical protein D5086_030659 [Populus alba]|uniref:Uncharacterized protein n=1 Tax=Populus alba TaxID=43335 RepID=A0ACC4AQG4_POPAL